MKSFYFSLLNLNSAEKIYISLPFLCSVFLLICWSNAFKKIFWFERESEKSDKERKWDETPTFFSLHAQCCCVRNASTVVMAADADVWRWPGEHRSDEANVQLKLLNYLLDSCILSVVFSAFFVVCVCMWLNLFLYFFFIYTYLC